jgi:hypothetical protein
MLNGTVLDVAIGLIFIYLMLSVACSWLNERIQSVLDTRARMLDTAIRNLLGAGWKDLAAQLKSHALISAISHAPSNMPSYLPSSTFAMALIDTLVPVDGEHPLTLKRLRDAILGLPESTRPALLALVNAAEGDIAAVRSHVEHWFDNAMDRVSGLYKRHVAVWLFLLGFVLAVATNADTILLVQRLEHESALRAAVTRQVTDASAQEAAAPKAAAPKVDAIAPQLPIDQEQLQRLDLLFWDTECVVNTPDEAAHHPRAMHQPAWSRDWLLWLVCKLLGCLMTALAISLGAPFWFDLLGRVVNLRATGAKPARAAKPAATSA